MFNENYNSRSQLKGYIFELVLMELLRKNGFVEVDSHREPNNRIREIREDFVEFKGRGCWHQIDMPCDTKDLFRFHIRYAC